MTSHPSVNFTPRMIFIIAREFAEQPFRLAPPREDATLQNVFRSPGQVQALRVLDHPVGLALHHRRHLQEVVVDQDINLYALMPLFRVTAATAAISSIRPA
jgi:hypothetical protein